MTRSPRFLMPLDGDPSLLPGEGTILAMHPTDAHGLDRFDTGRLCCVQHFRPVAEALSAMGLTVTQDCPDVASMAIVFATRNRAETLSSISTALQSLDAGATLIVDGQKTDGIDSHLKKLRAGFEIDTVHSRSHGKAFSLRRPATLPDEVIGWQETTKLGPNRDGYMTHAGLFSANGIDPGSALLMRHLGPETKGHVADFGAGWGVLAGHQLNLAKGIETLDLIEADARAIDAARANVSDPRARFHWADVTTLPAPEASYDLIISNPPFHIERKADVSLGLDFLRSAARCLAPRGRLILVANRQLAYEAELTRLFRHWEQIEVDARYKIIEARTART